MATGLSIAARLSCLAGRSLKWTNTSGAQLQAVRGMFSVDNKNSEPAASPWIKMAKRPGDDPENRSEVAPVVTEGRRAESPDVSADVPEKNHDTQPQAPIDPEVLAAAEANPSVDSVRYMAGKLNEAVGGDFDFPKTGGASIREMGAEIGSNIKESLGMHPEQPVTQPLTKADEKLGKVAEKVDQKVSSAYEAAKEAVTGSKDERSSN